MGTTPFRRRSLLAGSAASSLLLPRLASAQTILPDKALHILVGSVSGSSADLIARQLAVPLQRRVGRHVSVDNRPGGSGAIPAEHLKKDPGDGTTVAFLASTTLVSQLVLPNVPFDPLSDITPITLAGTWPVGLAVSPKLGVKTFDEYKKWLTTDDAKSPKLGNTANDAFFDAFNLMVGKTMGVKFQAVTYRGASPLVGDLADGRLPAAISAVMSLVEYHRGGKLRLLMTTGPTRLASARDVPTARELGYENLEDVEWFAFFASARTPAKFTDEWRRHLHAVLSDKGLATEMAQFGLTLETSTSEEATARIVDHLKTWKERMKSVGMAPTN